ncbi:YihY/virulence factor BrkB family protein [Pseudalkalibacillus berkeleyi]|uniref:YihY/virulence factor BrkB family protein n=1 Tax=Pseudalkalibacillus berkeleyi TaxID=1069813 RepID=A0ABS9H5R2_9BACL|nr:YihY/virulence factor BrkB family protein [Pseudalkalibacillus berkeleyi]MCF6139289.1 YihY/virulence factor BrkB family protein [Pseudalkalibacillus berkeleyi]
MRRFRQPSKKVFWKDLIQRIKEDGVTDLSAQLAYYFLLSLFPFLIVAITVVTALIDESQLYTMLDQYGPPELMNIIQDNSELIGGQGGAILSIGIIGTLWTASNGMNAVIRALNQAYDVDESRNFIVARAVAISLTIGMLLIIFVAMALPVFGQMIGNLFFYIGIPHYEEVWNVLRWVLSTVIIAGVITIIYFVAPNKKLTIRDVWVGAVVATVGWQLVSLAFSYYVNNFANYSATYGSLGGVIVLMLWFYVSGLMLIIGGEVNATFKHLEENPQT